MVVYQALQWVADMGFDDMNFTLDLKVMVDAFNGGRNDITEFESIIQHCRQLFGNSFHNSMIQFSWR